MTDLSYVAKFPKTCDHEVSRRGESQPCEKPAVAAKLHEGIPFPVCAYHSYGAMVSLADLLHRPEAKAGAWDEGVRFGWERCREPEGFENDWWDIPGSENPYRPKPTQPRPAQGDE